MPDDMMLSMSLSNVPMNITVDVWEIGGNSGNYIIAVSRAQQPVQTVSQNQSIHQAAQNVQQQPVQQVQYAQPQQPTAQQLEAADIDF
jgi:hypothetical protein